MEHKESFAIELEGGFGHVEAVEKASGSLAALLFLPVLHSHDYRLINDCYYFQNRLVTPTKHERRLTVTQDVCINQPRATAR
jgi:hypothetical protein